MSCVVLLLASWCCGHDGERMRKVPGGRRSAPVRMRYNKQTINLYISKVAGLSKGYKVRKLIKNSSVLKYILQYQMIMSMPRSLEEQKGRTMPQH